MDSLTRNVTDSTIARTDLNWVHKLAEGAKLDVKMGLSYGLRDTEFYQRGFHAGNVQKLDSTVIATAKDSGFTFTGKYSTPIVEGHALVAGWDMGLLLGSLGNLAAHYEAAGPLQRLGFFKRYAGAVLCGGWGCRARAAAAVRARARRYA